MSSADTILDRSLDLFFTRNKTHYFVLALLFLGFILRTIAALNLNVAADDMHYAPHALDIWNVKLLGTVDQPPLWYYLTDFFYHIFGPTQYGSRFASVLFGTFTILLVYLVGLQLFSKKIALFAATFMAFSPFHIHLMMAEMDPTAVFFIFLSAYFLLRSLEERPSLFLLLSGISLGIAGLVKYYALIFTLPFIAYFFYRKSLHHFFSKQSFYLVLLFFGGFFICVLPSLIHNYFLYTQHHVLDFQFARFLNIGKEPFIGLSGIDDHFSFASLFGFSGHSSGLLTAGGFYLYHDAFLLFFGLLGFILLFRKQFNAFVFLFFVPFLPFLFLAGTSLIPKHFIFALPFFALSVGYFFSWLFERFSLKQIFIYGFFILYFVAMLLSFGWNYNSIYTESAVAQFMSASHTKIPQNSLIIVDSRVYRSITSWLLNQYPYLEANYFPTLLQQQSSLPGNAISTSVYFVECVPDNCGWSTVKDINASMEQLFTSVKKQGEYLGTFSEIRDVPFYVPGLSSVKPTPYFALYRLNILIKPAVLSFVEQTHWNYLQPVRYHSLDQFLFYYTPHTSFEQLLFSLGYFILVVSFIVALLSVFLVLFFYAETLHPKQ